MEPSRFTARADLGFAWSVKDTFLRYVRSTPDGDIAWSAGAAVTNTGEFYFPLTDARRTSDGIVLSFRGSVAFTAHRGMLSVSIVNPRIVLRGGRGQLLSRVAGSEAVIATISLSPPIHDEDVSMWLNCGASLAESGSDLFGGTYPAGELLAPLTLRVPTHAVQPTVAARILVTP